MYPTLWKRTKGWELVVRKEDAVQIARENPGVLWYDHFAAELGVIRGDDPDVLESLSVRAGFGVPPRAVLS